MKKETLNFGNDKMINQFSSIDQIWQAIDDGKKVYWCNQAYEVLVIDANENPETHERQKQQVSYRNGKLLRSTCMSNWFGSTLTPNCIKQCFTIEKGV